MPSITKIILKISIAIAFLAVRIWAEQPYRQLFFDDQRLYIRENLERVYGNPELAGVYQDTTLAVEYGWVWALDGQDGKVHLVYLGEHKNSHQLITAAAISYDGVNFEPRNTAVEAGLPVPQVANQLLPNPPNGEIGSVLMDPIAPESERYKLFFCDFATLDQGHVLNYLWTSPDLIHWTKMDNSCWQPIGTEPMVGAFYNPVFKNYTILSRPDWGQRRVARTETADWHAYTPLVHCLQTDALDPVLAEIYGMPAFHYHGWFVGFPHIFYDVPQVRNLKFAGGRMRCEIAYSLNGLNWQRTLRQAFLDGENPQLQDVMGGRANMVFLTSMREDDDGSILLYGSGTLNEHGASDAGCVPERSKILIYRLRRDGFIGLKTVDDSRPATIASRGIVCIGKDLSINLQAEHATCAVYAWTWSASPEPLPGYSHEECVPFSGDNAEWHPAWKEHQNLSGLEKRLLVIEIKLQNGIIYSFSIEGIPQMEIECNRYLGNATPTERPGF